MLRATATSLPSGLVTRPAAPNRPPCGATFGLSEMESGVAGFNDTGRPPALKPRRPSSLHCGAVASVPTELTRRLGCDASLAASHTSLLSPLVASMRVLTLWATHRPAGFISG